MNDTNTKIQDLKNILIAFNQDRDWQQYHCPRNLAMALNVEASELLSLFLWSSDNGPQPPIASRIPKVHEEAADVMICLLNFCSSMNIDLAQAVYAKIQKNNQKYPIDKSRGKLEKHDEL